MKSALLKKLTSIICILCMILMVYAYIESNDPMYLAISILIGLSASLQIYIGYIDKLLHSYIAFNEKVTSTLMSNQLNLIKANLNILDLLCAHGIIDQEEVNKFSEITGSSDKLFNELVQCIHSYSTETTDD